MQFRISVLCWRAERLWGTGIRSRGGAISMQIMKERRPATRTLRGWAISVLLEAGAIQECEQHGWTQDRADPHARERAFEAARLDPPDSVSSDKAVAEVR